jgi:hypothetical protein
MFVTESVARERRIGPGDLVFMVGLFTRMTVTRKSFPIVRMGNMAMMPSEKRRFHAGKGTGSSAANNYLRRHCEGGS